MDPTTGTLATVAGIGATGLIIVEVILRVTAMTGAAKDRWAPAIAVIVGIALGIIGQVGTGSNDFILGALLGITASGTSMGLHDLIAGPVAKGIGGAGAAIPTWLVTMLNIAILCTILAACLML